jgi:hypothetical protein
VDEEYAWLLSQGYHVREQSLLKSGPHQLDAIDVLDQSGTERTVYFNIDRPAAWLAKRFPAQTGNASSLSHPGAQ